MIRSVKSNKALLLEEVTRLTGGFSFRFITDEGGILCPEQYHLLKAEEDNPTIGLLICSDMNKADVQWSFRGISTPMGVATYNNVRIKDMLPTQEQLKERMELLQRELRETKRLMKANK